MPVAKTTQPSHTKVNFAVPVEKENQVSLPPPPDLLDLNEEVPAALSSRDPLEDLEGLLDLTDSVASSNHVPVNAKPSSGVDIFSLYEANTMEHSAGMGKNNIIVDLMADIMPGERMDSRLGRPASAVNSASKKGHSIETSIQKDAQSRQVGVNPTSPNPDLFKDLLK